jgi:FtsZ-binding cell division protein ZapB
MNKKNKEAEEQLSIDGAQEAEMLTRLADRVERAIVTISDLRKQRDELRQRLETAEGDLQTIEDDRGRLTELEDENQRYRSERDQIRNRIEGLLDKLEALEESED